MADFWFNIFWTVLIAFATVLTDWIAAKFIGYTRGFTAIQRAADQAVTGGLWGASGVAPSQATVKIVNIVKIHVYRGQYGIF